MPNGELASHSVERAKKAPKAKEHLRVVKPSPEPVELPPLEGEKLAKKQVQAMVTERQELDDQVKAIDLRSKIGGGKDEKKRQQERKALVARVMEINADLEAHGVEVPRQVDFVKEVGETLKKRKVGKKKGEEGPMAGEPMAWETPAPVELAPAVEEAKESLVPEVEPEPAKEPKPEKPARVQELENEIHDLMEGSEVREGGDFHDIRGLKDIEKELDRFGVDADQMMVSGWKRFKLGLRGVFQPRVTALVHEYRSRMKAIKPKMDELENLRGSGVSKLGIKRRGIRQKKMGEMANR